MPLSFRAHKRSGIDKVTDYCDAPIERPTDAQERAPTYHHVKSADEIRLICYSTDDYLRLLKSIPGTEVCLVQRKVNRSANARPAVAGRPLAHYDTGQR
jgi:hypothetical protein